MKTWVDYAEEILAGQVEASVKMMEFRREVSKTRMEAAVKQSELQAEYCKRMAEMQRSIYEATRDQCNPSERA